MKLARRSGLCSRLLHHSTTPRLMTELVAWVNQEREAARLHPLLIIALCVVSFS